MPLETLKKRAQFLRIRGGRRHATPAFVLEGKARAAPGESDLSAHSETTGARFGFTVTKKLGGAVDRNRIRRRLKAAAERAGVPRAKPNFDYVVIARRTAIDRPFDNLLDDFATALGRLHVDGPNRPRRKKRSAT